MRVNSTMLGAVTPRHPKQGLTDLKNAGFTDLMLDFNLFGHLNSVIGEDYNGDIRKKWAGLSKEQREYLHEHTEEIIGSTVKVQYFEETNNMQGGISLRFPTVVYFYGKTERFD